MRVRARHYATGELVDVVCAGRAISSVEAPSGERADRESGWVAPAWFDLQVNGCDGRSFNSERLTIDDVRHIVGVCQRHGIGALCPTLVTNAHAALAHGLATLRRACETEASLDRALPVFHLEGPYLSPDDGPRGAHPRQHIRPPDWDEFCRLQDAAGGRIRLLTLAPEHEGALRFIERLVAAGVVVALGHTAADGPRLRDAVRAGARLSTHLGNGAHAMLPRHPNYIWEQLAADELWASIICDGHHLPASVARCIVRVKTPARTILTCDASSLAGLPPGTYREWDQEFEVLSSGRVVLKGTSFLGGSGVFTDACVGRATSLAGVTLKDAVGMAGARPRALLGLPARSLQVGEPVDLVLFEWQEGGELRVTDTLIAGKPIG